MKKINMQMKNVLLLILSFCLRSVYGYKIVNITNCDGESGSVSIPDVISDGLLLAGCDQAYFEFHLNLTDVAEASNVSLKVTDFATDDVLFELNYQAFEEAVTIQSESGYVLFEGDGEWSLEISYNSATWRVINVTDCSQDTEGNFTEVDVLEHRVLINGCDGGFLRLTMIPTRELEVTLTITDQVGLLVNVDDVSGFTETVSVATRGPTAFARGWGHWSMDFEYKSIVSKTEVNDNMGGGEGSVEVTNLSANNRKRNTFTHEQDYHRFNLTWSNLRGPSTGFVAIQAPNGRWGVINSMPKNDEPLILAVPTSTDDNNTDMTTTIDVITQNSLKSFMLSKVSIDYDLGVDTTTTTGTTTSTTTTINLLDNSITIFVVGVNEDDFYANQFDELLMLIQNLSLPYTNPGGKCIISNSPAASCRDRCFLTNDPDRGCVSTTVSVEPTIQCSYNNRQLRIDLEDHKNQWAKQFKARRISLDECIQDERSWIIVSILTPIVILVFFVAAFLIVKLIIKPRSRQRSFQKTREYEEKQRLSKSKTSFQAGRAYSNHLEVLDQDDEY